MAARSTAIFSGDVLAALDRLLASDHFVHAERMSAFLRFAVEKTLAGDGAKLKEYVIGTDVFGKGAEFDPRLDPVVRVEARRLRAKLQEYYEGPGQADAIRITFRKGGYAPSFDHAPPIARSPQDTGMPDPGTRKPHRGAWLWAGAALAVAGIALLVARHGPAGPVSLVVIPSAKQAEEQGFADGLAQAVAAELTHESAWRVVAWPRFAEYRQTHGGPGSLTTGATAKDLSAGAVLTVGTRLREGRRLVFAVLMKPEQGFKDWAGEYERGLTDEFAVQRELARSIAGDMDRRPSSAWIGRFR